MPAHVLVAGGGIGGLTTALALARDGHRVDVLEQAPRFAEIGAGIQLGPNVTRRLRASGLVSGAALERIAARPQALQVRGVGDIGGGEPIARLPLADDIERRYGAPYLCVHRGDLHALLLDAVRAAPNVALAGGAAVDDVHAGDTAVCVSTADARAWEGDALVGADGLWSTVRRHVAGTAPAHATGHTAWRAIVAQRDLPAALRSGDITVWLGARLHAVAYPVRGGEWLNLVVLAEAAPAGDACDWDQATGLSALQHATGRCGAGLRALMQAMPDWRAWTLIDRDPLDGPQQMAAGRVALLGDAAHPMLPYLAQGAGMAIEDAVALADALGTGGAADVPAALARYAAARWARNAAVQRRARRNGHVFHLSGPARWARDLALHAGGARLLDQPWLFGG